MLGYCHITVAIGRSRTLVSDKAARHGGRRRRLDWQRRLYHTPAPLQAVLILPLLAPLAVYLKRTAIPCAHVYLLHVNPHWTGYIDQVLALQFFNIVRFLRLPQIAGLSFYMPHIMDVCVNSGTRAPFTVEVRPRSTIQNQRPPFTTYVKHRSPLIVSTSLLQTHKKH